jgi:hypothetical protein
LDVSDCSLRELDARARTAYDCFGLVDQGVHYMSKSRFGSGALRTAAIAGVFCAVGALAAGSADAVVTQAVNVTTFHYDNYRTGWDQAETVLTPKAVQKGAGGLTFQMTSFTALDDQVDAQPLVMTGQSTRSTRRAARSCCRGLSARRCRKARCREAAATTDRMWA